MNGAGDRIRTGDINLGKVALYQLSYSRFGLETHCLRRKVRMSIHAIDIPKPDSYEVVSDLSHILLSY